MFIKEFVQLRRDRLTFATMIFIPVMQLLLFGFAINTTPRHLPTAVLDARGQRPRAARSWRRCDNTSYFDVDACRPLGSRDGPLDALGRRCCSASRSRPASSAPCGAATSPALLVAADASDPVAAGTALGALEGIVHARRWRATAACPRRSSRVPAFEIRQHRRYNPAGVTSLNIVPGLLGTILTMTMLIFTALSVTREVERGTMESLLAMPIKPVEIMLGKIAPYIVIGFMQAALILRARRDRVRRADRAAASRCWRR